MNSSLEIFCVQKQSSFRDKLNFHFKIISYLNIHYHSNFSSKILDFQALLDMLTFFKGIYTSSGSIVMGIVVEGMDGIMRKPFGKHNREIAARGACGQAPSSSWH